MWRRDKSRFSKCPSIGKWLVALFLIGWAVSMCTAQSFTDGIPKIDFALSDIDINETIKAVKTDNPAEAAKLFQQKMPPPATDSKFRAKIIESLPPFVEKLRVRDEKMIAELKLLISPVLSFYNRESLFEIIVIQHPTPFLMADSGVLIVISTGFIEEVNNDDELLGYIAHEVGHEYFQQYSIYSKYLLGLIENRGQETALARHTLIMLSLIELKCDAFAAITLSHLKYNPTAFGEFLTRTTKKFPSQQHSYHPPEAIRNKVISGVLPALSENLKVTISAKLLALQKRSKHLASK